jgi:hypothetical protein
MHVHDDDRRVRLCLFDDVVDDLERTHGRIDEERAEQVDHRDVLDDEQTLAGSTCREVRWSHDAIALAQVRDDLPAAPDVVPEGDRIGAGREHAVGELRRDADAVGEILAVEDAEVGVQLVA